MAFLPATATALGRHYRRSLIFLSPQNERGFFAKVGMILVLRARFFVLGTGMRLALNTERRASVMDKEKMILFNEALAQEYASQIRCAAADRLKKVTEEERKHAEALRDRIVYEIIEEIVRDERRHQVRGQAPSESAG
jgi:hypothetical protein